VGKDVVALSSVLLGMVDGCDSGVIPVTPPASKDHGFAADDLGFTLELMRLHKTEDAADGSITLDPRAYARAREIFRDREKMIGVSHAAQFLDVPAVTEMVAAHFVDSISGMAPPQIREFMGLPPWESMTPQHILEERESEAVKTWIEYLTR
jgi:hypothetical protein